MSGMAERRAIGGPPVPGSLASVRASDELLTYSSESSRRTVTPSVARRLGQLDYNRPVAWTGRWDWSYILRWTAVAALVIAALRAVLYYRSIPEPSVSIGIDFRLYTDAARTWLATGQLYPARELAGAYQVLWSGEILYPPIVLWLLVPFTVLPFVAWIVAPIALTVIAIARMRPAAWALTAIGALCVTHAVQAPFFWGTPVIWLIPAVAWGLLEGYPAALLLIKPMFAPLMLPALRQPRRVAIGAAVLVGLSLPFGALWLDWIAAIRNSNLTLAYGIEQVIPLSLPLIAWIGRTRRSC